MAKQKINITLDNELVSKIDEYSKKYYMTRSGFLSQASSQFLMQHVAADSLKELSTAMRKIAESSKITDEDKAEMESILRACAMITGE